MATLITRSRIRASLPTATLDAICRDRELVNQRLAAKARLEAFARARGLDGFRDFFLGDIPDFKAASVTTITTCDADVVLEMPAVSP
jgi:hypothetical protein